MNKVFKYELYIGDVVNVEMPIEAQILCVQAQKDIPIIWAIVDPENPVENKTFYIFGTGQVIPKDNNLKYIGTVQLLKGELVFHIFE
jgi:hypothetical protein